MTYPVSEKQERFIDTLLAQVPADAAAAARQVRETAQANGTWTGGRGGLASRLIDGLLTAKAAAPKAAMLDTDGMFEQSGTIYKVQFNQAGTSLYAKRLDLSNPDAPEWVYEGKKPLYSLTEVDRLTAERAAQLGHLYGCCCVCASVLTDERSIVAGYGPTCARNNGWPFPTKAEADAILSGGGAASALAVAS